MSARSPLPAIFLIVLVDTLGLTIVLPLLPFYAEHLGASATMVGVLFSSYAVCQFLASPIVGNISDRIGRKPMLLFSQAGTFAGLLLLAGAQSFPMVLLSRIIDGATAGNISIAQAYIADVSRPGDRARALGLIGVAFGVGFLFGPGISGLLFRYGYAFPILAAAALSLLSIICTTVLLPNTDPLRSAQAQQTMRAGLLNWRGHAKHFSRPVLGGLLTQYAVFAFCFTFFFSACALFAERRFTWDGHPFHVEQVAAVFAYIGFITVIVQGFLIGKLVRAFGERSLVWTGFGVTAVSSVWLAWTYTVPGLLLNATFGSYGTAVVRTALTARVTHAAGRFEQGAVLGLTQSFMSISQILAPPLAGMLIDRDMLVSWNLVVAALACAGLLLALFTARRDFAREQTAVTAGVPS